MDARAAVRRYEEIRHRLPAARFPAVSTPIETLADLAGEIDVFLLDAFGVLNVGETPIPGAVDRMRDLARLGKRLFVITNSATYTRVQTHEKFRRLGYDFDADQVVSSREAALAALSRHPDVRHWAVAAPAHSGLEEIGLPVTRLEEDEGPYHEAGGFLFLSSSGWTAAKQALLIRALEENPRPLLVGNPDLVAPREDGLSIEPGSYAHDIADQTGIAPAFYGKPFFNVFEGIVDTLRKEGIPPQRVAMVGDTLHTDILGGAAAGFRTVLVTDHGLLRDLEVDALIAETGIVPDFIAATT